MSDYLAISKALRERIEKREPVVGTFVKTPSPHIVEILGNVGLEFIVLDAEHAPFDTASLDMCLLAARSVSLPALVRIPNKSHDTILRVLDMGASGIVVPHIQTSDDVKSVVDAAQYRNAGRGFSASQRAADYGAREAWSYTAESDESLILIGQIEDADGVKNAASIAAETGMSGILIGPADLANSLGEKQFGGPKVERAIDDIKTAFENSKMAVGIFVGTSEGANTYLEKGISFFTASTDQALLRKAAIESADKFRNLSDK
ncbi:aldolase/citrate lyase family protein [Hyphococcus formosus]|uniref:HpcH/HpaI aldolase family protein n=1 Tax=Hyphococcus formosus TaxID=3143534 RepID=UPI00398B2BDE